MAIDKEAVRIALISADLGGCRRNLSASYVKQDLPEGWSLDAFFFDDANFPSRPSLSARLQSKIPKMLGYELLPGYDFYIWIDSSFILSDSGAVAWFVSSCAGRDMVVFRHPQRSSIADELGYIKGAIGGGDAYLAQRYDGEPIKEQVKLYLADPAFRDESLYALGAFVYSKEMLGRPERNLMPLWYYHNARYSIQDQISFPYLAASLSAGGGLRLGSFDADIFANRYIRFAGGEDAPAAATSDGEDSNVGKWDDWYRELTPAPGAFKYSDTVTYELGSSFLADCRVVEDWGTGAGGFKRFRPDAIGVDGSNTPHAQKKYVDLVTYVSPCDGVFMRHVLEHNYNWAPILRNALKSATRKLCLVLFTPISESGTKEIAHNRTHGVDVPDLSLGLNELQGIFREFPLKQVRLEQIESATGYGVEYLIYIEK